MGGHRGPPARRGASDRPPGRRVFFMIRYPGCAGRTGVGRNDTPRSCDREVSRKHLAVGACGTSMRRTALPQGARLHGLGAPCAVRYGDRTAGRQRWPTRAPDACARRSAAGYPASAGTQRHSPCPGPTSSSYEGHPGAKTPADVSASGCVPGARPGPPRSRRRRAPGPLSGWIIWSDAHDAMLFNRQRVRRTAGNARAKVATTWRRYRARPRAGAASGRGERGAS